VNNPLIVNTMSSSDENPQLSGDSCSQIRRIDWHYAVHELGHALHLEKGIFYTVKQLALRPGPSIQEFITQNRSRLMKPILFLLVTSLIYTTLDHFFHIEQSYLEQSSAVESAANSISAWLQNHYGYANLIMGVLVAVWVKLLFMSQGYNFFEILILLCFVMGMGMLIISIALLVEGITGLKVWMVSTVVGVLYSSWAIGHFFNR